MAGDLTLRITVTEIETLQKPWFCPGESPVLCSGWSPATGLPDPLARRPLPGRRRSGGNHDLGFFCHISRSCRPGYENRSPVSDRKSTRLNSSHVAISYAVFCLKKKKTKNNYITLL